MTVTLRQDGLPSELSANAWDGQGPVSGRLAREPYNGCDPKKRWLRNGSAVKIFHQPEAAQHR